MSEAQVVEEPKAPVPPVAPVPEVTATPETETPPPPEKTFTQKELDEILEKRLAKERRKRKEREEENAALRRLALQRDERREEPSKPAQPAQGVEPKREDFDTYEAFIEARAEWRADKKVEERFTKEREEAKTRTAREQQEEQAKALRQRTKELAKGLDDFDEVMAEATADPQAAVSRILFDPVNECENPAAVLYHLAKNPDEAERIAALPGGKQAREIWALDAKLKNAPEPKKPSAAPAPIAPVGGKAVPVSEQPQDNDPTDVWMKKEYARTRKKR